MEPEGTTGLLTIKSRLAHNGFVTADNQALVNKYFNEGHTMYRPQPSLLQCFTASVLHCFSASLLAARHWLTELLVRICCRYEVLFKNVRDSMKPGPNQHGDLQTANMEVGHTVGWLLTIGYCSHQIYLAYPSNYEERLTQTFFDPNQNMNVHHPVTFLLTGKEYFCSPYWPQQSIVR